MKFSAKNSSHVIDLLFTLALFCVFTASSLMVVLIGANVYKKTVHDMTNNYDMRTSLTYISQKIRQNDVKGGVYLDEINKTKALVLEQKINNIEYQTFIYYDNGSLKELFTRKGNQFSIDDGREIMKIDHFDINYDGNGIYTFSATDQSGNITTVKSFTRCNSSY